MLQPPGPEGASLTLLLNTHTPLASEIVFLWKTALASVAGLVVHGRWVEMAACFNRVRIPGVCVSVCVCVCVCVCVSLMTGDFNSLSDNSIL